MDSWCRNWLLRWFWIWNVFWITNRWDRRWYLRWRWGDTGTTPAIRSSFPSAATNSLETRRLDWSFLQSLLRQFFSYFRFIHQLFSLNCCCCCCCFFGHSGSIRYAQLGEYVGYVSIPAGLNILSAFSSGELINVFELYLEMHISNEIEQRLVRFP